MDVCGRETVLVFLDEEGQLSRSIRPGNGRVWSDYGFSLRVLESLGVRGFDYDAGGEGKQRGLVVVQLEDKPSCATVSVVEAVRRYPVLTWRCCGCSAQPS